MSADNSRKKVTAASRRGILAGLAGAATASVAVAVKANALPFLPVNQTFDPHDFPICRTAADGAAGTPRKIKFSWNASSVCLAPVALAASKGIFAKHGLDVELINFGGSTDQLLEAIATGKSDAGVGMALRWLKPLEQGFDVKITAGTHGGCMRVLSLKSSGITDLKGLVGKTIAVSDMAAPGKNFFSIVMKKQGIDPDKDVEWRQFPGDLLRLAVEKGEAQALIDGDPKTYLWLKDGALTEVASNLDGEYRDRTCCILGVSGSLVRNEPATAKSLTLALLEAAEHSSHHADDAVVAFQPYVPNATTDDLRAMVRYHTHHHHPVGDVLKREIRAYADELKLVNVFKKTTDTAKFADRVYADVFSV